MNAVPAALSQAILDRYISWYGNPVKFHNDALDPEGKDPLEEWQIDSLMELAINDLVGLFGSKGTGKSRVEAVAGWWWMTTRKKAQVVCTSKDADTLDAGLWKEVTGFYQRSQFLQTSFEMNTEMAFARPDTSEPWSRDEWSMKARGWRRHADAVEQAQALASVHGDHMLWLGDEAGSYHKAILASGAAMRANIGNGREAKILLGGNTTDPLSALGDIASDEAWRKIRVNGDPDNPKRCKRVSIEWAREQIRKYGRDNPWVKVAVFAEFPDVGFNSLLGPPDVEASIRRAYLPIVYERAQKRMGVDVARFGDDATVIYIRQGLKAGPFLKLRGLDTMQVADRVALEFKRNGCEMVFVDETGNPGVVDALRRLLRGVQVIGVNSSSKATDSEKFWNKRAELCWDFADWIRNQGGQVPLNDLELHEEMTKPTYTFKNGRILIEDKAQIKALLGRSPDCYDALCLTLAAPEMPSVGGPMGLAILNDMARQRAKTHDPFAMNNRGDFDPFADRDNQTPEFRGYDPNDRPSGG